jgi:mono/diheme cytochrome c family protein
MTAAPALIAALALAAVLGGCATTDGASAPMTARERGYAIAQRECAICHNVSEENPNGAPSFEQMGRRFNALTFERRVREIAARGHSVMPPFQLAPDEAADLAAYVAAAAVRPAPCQTRVENDACSR